jgi:hypothetical protein
VAIATLKHLKRLDALAVNRKLTPLIADGGLRGVIDHLVRLLDFPPSDLQRCATDVDGHLVPRLRAVSSPVAIFIEERAPDCATACRARSGRSLFFPGIAPTAPGAVSSTA